ncbi:MAG TPA: DUF3526 domain-containing protein [Methylibium sp.]|uniref:DUF3526 domain-containing protein n=1 Tax=Methylibium sp. TaxID=2067992 RepID=UPI002DBBD696|nr:DUF3526 domain-containing protein [Methylibium sp.]HEU4458020.1 DUF3526 domain-containing protein [Methylibium sp.]
MAIAPPAHAALAGERSAPFGVLLRHELRLMLADRHLLWLALALLLACGYALANGAAWFARQDAAVAAARADEVQRIDKLRADLAAVEAGALKPQGAFYDPRSALWVGLRHGATVAAIAREPLALVSFGQSDLNPPYVKVSTDNADSFLFAEEIENPAHLLNGSFDLAFVVVFLAPLLALALAHDLLTGEKEQGTLKLLLAQPIRLRRLLAAKLGLRFALLYGALLAAGAAALALGDGFDAMHGALALGGWALLLAAYLAFWFALAAWVDLRGRSAASNALVLAGAWIALALLLPTLLGLAIQVLHPVPSRAEMVERLRASQIAVHRDAEATLARFHAEHPEMDPAGIAPDSDHARGVRRVALQAAAAANVQAEIARYDARLAAQQALVDRLRFVSPAVVMQQALNDLAGTGTARYRAFNDEVARFHARWQAWFRPKVLANRPLAAADYAALPRFEPARLAPGAVVAAVVAAAVGLLLPTLALLFAAARRLRRYVPV